MCRSRIGHSIRDADALSTRLQRLEICDEGRVRRDEIGGGRCGKLTVRAIVVCCASDQPSALSVSAIPATSEPDDYPNELCAATIANLRRTHHRLDRRQQWYRLLHFTDGAGEPAAANVRGHPAYRHPRILAQHVIHSAGTPICVLDSGGAAIGSKPASTDRLSSRLPSLYLFLVGPENVVPERGDHSEIALVDAMMHAMGRPSLLQPSEWNLVDPRRMLHMVKRVEVEVTAR